MAEFTRQEWESLCDGCGKCCLHKLEDEDSGDLFYTNVACYLLSLKSCQCSRYPDRSRWVPDCVELTPENVGNLEWMPTTCAYRLVAEGKPLASWHHLISGDRTAIHRAGASVRGWAVSERKVQDIEQHIIDWRP